MNKPIHSLPKTTSYGIPERETKVNKKKALPVKVKTQQLEKNKPIQAVKGSKDVKVHTMAVTTIQIPIQNRPIDLWEVYPKINLIEIRNIAEIQSFKRDLTHQFSKVKQIPETKEYDLSPFGLSKKVQVIGNVYVPIKRSEHLDIQTILLKTSPELGIKNKQAITFIIIDDELWDHAMPELQRHSATILTLPQENVKEEKEAKVSKPNDQLKQKNRNQNYSFSIFNSKTKEQVFKILMDLIAEEFYKKDRAEKRKERELELKEKCIKFAIEQYERLQKMVLNEANKRNLSRSSIDIIVKKWEDSCPPFPIRTIRSSVLWRELKSKMIESFYNF